MDWKKIFRAERPGFPGPLLSLPHPGAGSHKNYGTRTLTPTQLKKNLLRKRLVAAKIPEKFSNFFKKFRPE